MKDYMKSFILFLAAFALFASSISSHGADGAPKSIEYQGVLLDAAGNPLALTAPNFYLVEFRLWDQLEGGTLIWAEKQFVKVFQGQFSARIGEGQTIAGGAVPHERLDLAFGSPDRYLGITVTNPSTAKSEISPRFKLLSTPYVTVANIANSLVQQSDTSSSIIVSAVAYSTQNHTAATVNLAIDKRTNLISAGVGGTTAMLPSDGNLSELVIIKTDNTPQFVRVSAPAGGTINSSKTEVRLKIKGDSVTLQNVGGNNWWIVKDSRDRTPVGTIIAYGGMTPPLGYLACDGTSLARTLYPDLFEAVATTWGASSSNTATLPPAVEPLPNGTATHFNLPNLNHQFLRGINPGAGGADEDAGSRVRIYAGGNSVVGSYQFDSVRRHLHPITDNGHIHNASISASGPSFPFTTITGDGEDGTDGFDTTSGDSSTNFTMGVSVTMAGSNTGITQTQNVTGIPAANISGVHPIAAATIPETRPDSAVVRFCIKY